MSLVEFKAVEYQGSKRIVASDEIKEQILKTGIRKVERETTVSHHTIGKILKGESVRRKTLDKVMKQLTLSATLEPATLLMFQEARRRLPANRRRE